MKIYHASYSSNAPGGRYGAGRDSPGQIIMKECTFVRKWYLNIDCVLEVKLGWFSSDFDSEHKYSHVIRLGLLC